MDNREIDRLTAEKVMGWHAKKDLSKYPNAGWYDKDGQFVERAIMWDPSENIERAWQVVEKMLSEKHYFSIQAHTFYIPPAWVVRMGEQEETNQSISLAICLVALKAVGVEVEEKEVRDVRHLRP